jgi:hypothetical protein
MSNLVSSYLLPGVALALHPWLLVGRAFGTTAENPKGWPNLSQGWSASVTPGRVEKPLEC